MASGSRSMSLAVIGCTDRADGAVDHDMSDMDALWRQFARHALRELAQRELAQRELAQRERSRLREALEPGRGACEKHRTVPLRQHVAHGLLGNVFTLSATSGCW